MSTAAARAEARRKAILSRGSDRLSKLTSSARGGEDTSHLTSGASRLTLRTIFLIDDDFPGTESPLYNKHSGFTGDDPPELPLPKLPSETVTQRHRSAQFDNGPTPTSQVDPSVWSEEQQAAFMRAMNMASASNNSGAAAPPHSSTPSWLSNDGTGVDFLNALMAPSQERPKLSSHSSVFNAESTTNAQKQNTWLQRLLPLVHVLSVWILFAFFVLWQEPGVFNTNYTWKSNPETTIWQRWARLAPDRRTVERIATVQPLVRRHYIWCSTHDRYFFSLAFHVGFHDTGTRHFLYPCVVGVCTLISHFDAFSPSDPFSGSNISTDNDRCSTANTTFPL
jgi:GET complex subunit GET2